MVRIGWKAGLEQYPPLELLDYAIEAERAGFESIDASDHFHPWAEPGQASFVWTWLGAVAARTSRIVLGTGITAPILRYHPAVIAQAAATLAAMAPGRTYLGVGTGEALNEYAAVGEWPGYLERQERLQEAIQLIRQLWTGEPTTHLGVYYETRKAKIYTRPEHEIPNYESSMVPGSAEFAGEYGDALITVGGKQPEIYKQLLSNFEQGARKAGKDPARMPRMIELNVAYTDDVDAAVNVMKEYWAGTFVPALFNQKIYTPSMSAENGESVGADTMKKQMCISADPEVHARFIQQYIDLGFDNLIIHSAGPDQMAFIHGYGRDVLPRFKQLRTAKAA